MREFIKKIVIVLFLALALLGCGSRKTMPSLEEAGKMEEAQLKEKLSEFGRSEINAAWGEGADPFFGRYGEVFPLEDERALILYYEGDGQTVEDVRIGENIQEFEGTIKEIYSGSAEPSVVKTYEVTDSEAALEDDELVTMVRYYEMSDGTWKTDDCTYQYRLEITGRMGNAVKDTTFVFLSNRNDITFDQAWKASGLSSSMEDYFEEEDAIFVAFGN